MEKLTPVTVEAAPPVVVCGPHDPKVVYDLILKEGVPRIAALQLLGSWQTESGFDQCQKRGDGGIAWGLNSWHPGRRHDMPERLEDQIHWAIKVEMPRDCRSCYDQFMNASTAWEARDAIQRSTRWGIEGSRWLHADRFSSIF